ncbi:DUF3179 domain-containing protein, partial [Patescibacteria group bacterium]|nr:DUF3179 domain-containing protein [Patescibacteria group bacterium]
MNDPGNKMNPWQKAVAVVVAVVLIIVFAFLFRNVLQRIEKADMSYQPMDEEQIEKVEGLPVAEEVTAKARLQEFARNIRSGGPPKDGIPPIDKPKYISIEDSETFLEDEDWVFITVFDDEIKMYPQKILVWHEIVNDTFGGQQGSVTYCPLTGTVIGFRGAIEGATTTFGTSGKLLNSNLVMYDRDSDSYWPQVLRTAVTAPRTGEVLTSFPAIWAQWKNAKAKYPNAQVLSKRTGFIRAYGVDPYGDYQDERSYYSRGGAFFPLMNK